MSCTSTASAAMTPPANASAAKAKNPCGTMPALAEQLLARAAAGEQSGE